MDSGFWDRFAPLYDLAMRSGDAGMREAIAFIARHLPEPVDKVRLLDAACGTGAFALGLAPLVGYVTATDFAPKMVERTAAKARRQGLGNVDCRQADVTCLLFSDDAFDVAVAGNVLHLLADPGLAVSELERVVRPGGLLVLPTYVNAEQGGNSAFLRVISRLGFAPKAAWDEEGYLRFVRSTGLEVKDHVLVRAKQPLCVAVAQLP